MVVVLLWQAVVALFVREGHRMSPPVARLFGDLLHRFQQEGEQRQAAYQAKRSQWTDLQLRLRVAQLEERLRMLGDQPPPGLPQSELELRLEDFQKLARQKAQAQLAFDLEQLAAAEAQPGAQSAQEPVPPEPAQPPGLVQVTLRPGAQSEMEQATQAAQSGLRRQELSERALAGRGPEPASDEGQARIPGAQWVTPVEAPPADQTIPPDHP